MQHQQQIREYLSTIVTPQNVANWTEPVCFEKNTRTILPPALEIIAPPPLAAENYNCFVYALHLQHTAYYLGHSGWDAACRLGDHIQQDIEYGIWKQVHAPEQGSMIVYRTDTQDISHVGIMDTVTHVISKWSWGPLLRHAIFDVPAHYGNSIAYYKK